MEATATWTIGQLLQWIQAHFGRQGIASARLDAELLLAAVLQQERIYLYTHYDQPIMAHERAQLRSLVQRRARREPLAYVLGEKEFDGRAFTVNPAVLIPRPETEELLELVLKLLAERQQVASADNSDGGTQVWRCWDVGTGSGVLAISLACRLGARAAVWASDNSSEALAVAKHNSQRHQVAEQITFVQGDLCAVWAELADPPQFDLIVANLPYIDRADLPQLAPDVAQYEPHSALFAAKQGLALNEQLLATCLPYLAQQGAIALEIGARQAAELRAYAISLAAYEQVEVVCDLAGKERFLLLRRGN